jgi:cation diffusion facilitator family transporter
MNNGKIEAENRDIRSVTNLAIAMNIVLAVAQAIIGFLAGSVSLVADAMHTSSDMVTDFVVLLGVRLGARQPDPKHPYGHGWIETYAAVAVAVVLAIVGSGMIYYAALEIVNARHRTPHIAVLIAALITVASKEWLYQVTRKVAVRTHSSLLYANAWHHRSDALSSVVVVMGFISLRLGFRYADQVAAVIVGIMIVLAGWKVMGDCIGELTERAVDDLTIQHIQKVINSNSRIRQWHKLRSRTVGRQVFLDFHILVDPELNVVEAHNISEELEKAVNEEIPRPVNITVHIEPDIPEMRAVAHGS